MFAAVDLGATSGRVITGRVGIDELVLSEVHRFANVPVRLPDGLRWNVLALYQGILDGLRAAARSGPIASVGIDTWAVDYGLLDADGALLGLPFHYRDARNAEAARQVVEGCGARSCTRSADCSICRSTRFSSSPPIVPPHSGRRRGRCC
ncbi:hypothetical protein NKH18_50785 [Streptomyces sp. M10(2022)]